MTCQCGRPTRDDAYTCDECLTDLPRCVVCSQPLPPQVGPGRPRKVCRDEDSPTPGGCEQFRANAIRSTRRPRRHNEVIQSLLEAGHGFTIE